MNTTRALPLIALALLAPPPSALARTPDPENRITVHGAGEVRVAPDMAVLTVEAAFTRNTPREAADETRKAVDAMLTAARKAVRDSGDLRTARISLNPEYDWVQGARKFRGYAASQSLEITLRDLAKVEALLDELFKTPMTGMGNLEFRHSGADSLRRAAGALAMRDAADNARNLCGAVNRSCEELVGARMTAAPAHGPFPAAEFKAMRADAGGSMPVQPGVLTFSAAVEADYRLK